ncbi:MAG: hypothetical protein HOV77_05645 [Hamadaea sp.]|uniref:hypothetical protein n=1 Tax=Hamadaea sp. TaxID=2024425 RepID=UPI0017D770CB|nr:hypothetical protein [Hamadaea sp.]NUT18648.1 hypothetical protein [Hamadaea sp.]
MRRARRTVAALLAAATLALSGCSGGPTGSAAKPTATPPSDSFQLVAALAWSSHQSSSVYIQQNVSGGRLWINTQVTGVLDGGKHNARLQLSQTRVTDDVEILVVDNQPYVKWTPADRQYAQIDLDQLAFVASPLRLAVDPTVNLGLLDGAADVKQTIPGTFRGTIDFAKARRIMEMVQMTPWLADFYDAAITGMKTSPSPATFVVHVDDEKRILDFTLSDAYLMCGQAVCRMNLSMRFKDFGTKVEVAPPTGVRKATEADYERL